MKQTDGLFHRVFEEIASEYPEIESEHWIVDIGAAKVADTPEHFDVIVMPNLYGDIISDIAAQITGSVGLAGSSNIGEQCAMFEAIHGSAPDIANKNIANPSGLLNGAIMMLNHLGQNNIAESIHNAWLVTIENGLHTADIYNKNISRRKLTTTEFADEIIANLGNKPKTLKEIVYPTNNRIEIPKYNRKESKKKELEGVDLFIHWKGTNPNELASILEKLNTNIIALDMITNRGIMVWPKGFEETFCTDHWRCRFKYINENRVSKNQIIDLLIKCNELVLDAIKTENLYSFDGIKSYSLGQGQ